jgi:hypothetical protein
MSALTRATANLHRQLRRPARFQPARRPPFSRGLGLIVRSAAEELFDLSQWRNMREAWLTLPFALFVVTGGLLGVGLGIVSVGLRSSGPLWAGVWMTTGIVGLYYVIMGYLAWAQRRLRRHAWAEASVVQTWDRRAAVHPQWATPIAAWLEQPRSVAEAEHADSAWRRWQHHDGLAKEEAHHAKVDHDRATAWLSAPRSATRTLVVREALTASLDEPTATARPKPRI